MNHDWPPEEKTTCNICGASFLACTAAETGGICRRHITKDNIPRPLREKEGCPPFISPEGEVFLSPDDLPTLPFPKKMIVGPGYLNFDDWIIHTSPLVESILGWIASHAGRWCQENPDPVVKEQINEMITALEQQMMHGMDTEEGIPESRWQV